MCTYDEAMRDVWGAVKILGITRATTVAQAEQILFVEYVRVNGGSFENQHSQSRVSAAAHDLIERGQIESWVARACETKVQIAAE